MSGTDDETALLALLDQAAAVRASDLHLCVDQPPLARVDGTLRPLSRAPLTDAQVVVLARTLERLGGVGAPRSGLDCAPVETESHPAGDRADRDFACSLARGHRVRANVYRTRTGVAVALRRLPEAPPSLEDLPAPPALESLIDLEHGLVLVVGPTGSGKSTTLAAMIDRINETRAAHILTIEDPIEYVHTNKKALISQREVGTHTPSFKAALRSALREDPDVLLVGEMRDLESISLALTAAETGQLVLATLHAPTAPKAVERIIDVFPGNERELVRSMLSSALAAVIAQRLLPRQEGGRIAAMEIITGNTAVQNQIRDGKTAQLAQTMEISQSFGMQTMAQSLVGLRSRGLLSQEEAAHWSRTLQMTGCGLGNGQDPQQVRQMRGLLRE